MNEYWDKRFQVEGKIWGDSPSRTAVYALELFQKNDVKKLIVPGSGYGRNTKLFSDAGFKVAGVEISGAACKIARSFDPATRVYNDTVLDMSYLSSKYDSVYCFNVLHLFRQYDRQLFVSQCTSRIKKQGLMFFTVFSEKEESYGKGKQIEKNTYESKPGRPVHYFDEDDLKAHFQKMEILETGVMEDPEDHGEGPHTHLLRYIYLRKNK
jgi:cyclopropane fatty-acyl-phospholipid synthase-like methyltransferase